MDYRPHAKSPTAGALFWTIIRGLQIRLDIVRTNEADGPSVASYPSSDDMLASYVDLSKRLGTELAIVHPHKRFRRTRRLAMKDAGNQLLSRTVSPRTRTVEADWLTVATCLKTFRIGSEVPTIWSNIEEWSISSRRARFSFRSFCSVS